MAQHQIYWVPPHFHISEKLYDWDFDHFVTIVLLSSEPATVVTIFNKCTKAFPALVCSAQEMNNFMGLPNRVTFHACEPIVEVSVAPVVVAVSQSQVTNILIKIDVAVVQLIVRVSTSGITWVTRGVKLCEIRFRCGSHGCNDMGGTNVDNVGIAPDMMLDRMEVNPGHLAIGNARLELPHCHSIVLGVVKCEVADLNDISDAKRV
jgi:hypothetical protein